MADWSRTVLPRRIGDLQMPGALRSRGQSGVWQTRAITQVGFSWTEEYLLKITRADDRALLTLVRQWWRDGTVFNINHRAYLTPLGSARDTDTVLVKGASQTGATIDVDSAPVSQTGYLKAGDLIKFAGVTLVYQVTGDVNTDSGGNATIPISPPIYAGGSPADNAAVTFENLTFQAVLAEPPEFPEAPPTEYGVLRVSIAETP